jgi:hypothetical protein
VSAKEASAEEEDGGGDDSESSPAASLFGCLPPSAAADDDVDDDDRAAENWWFAARTRHGLCDGDDKKGAVEASAAQEGRAEEEVARCREAACGKTIRSSSFLVSPGGDHAVAATGEASDRSCRSWRSGGRGGCRRASIWPLDEEARCRRGDALATREAEDRRCIP